MDSELYTSGQAAAQVGVPRWQLLYLIEKGEIPGPTLHVPGRRLFTREDIRNILAALNKRDAAEPANE